MVLLFHKEEKMLGKRELHIASRNSFNATVRSEPDSEYHLSLQVGNNRVSFDPSIMY